MTRRPAMAPGEGLAALGEVDVMRDVNHLGRFFANAAPQSLRATAKQSSTGGAKSWIASSQELLAMTEFNDRVQSVFALRATPDTLRLRFRAAAPREAEGE